MANLPTTRGFATKAPRPQPSRDVLVGRIFNNRFRIVKLLARGGMGKVYRAVQEPLGRLVALKVLNPTYTAEPLHDFHRRFFLEAAIAAQLTHPNTVTVFDFGKSDDNIYYIAMELLDGVSLRSAMARAPAFGARRALHVATQVAHAVAAAHALGAVHRDLKPANVFLLQRDDTPDFVKVLDFGLVKTIARRGDEITQPGKFLGSPGYMSPEQIRGEPVDRRCDVYALGVLLYEMLTGSPPFVRTNATETMMAHVHDPVPPMRSVHPSLRLPPRLDDVVNCCLAKDPARRFADMGSLLQALHEITGDDDELALLSHDTQVTPMRRLPQRLDDEEQSGWAVVTSTGVLAAPRRHALPAPTVAMQTQALPGPAPARPSAGRRTSRARHAPRPVRQPRKRRLVQWGLRLTVALAAILLAPWAGGWLHRLVRGWQHEPQTPSRVTAYLRSQPSGAQVFFGGLTLCPATPCTARLDLDSSPFGRVVSLHFVKPGYPEYVATRVITGPTLSLEPRLGDGT